MSKLKIGKFEVDYDGPNRLILGVDEVGKGCIAGPVSAGAVVFNPKVYRDIVYLVHRCADSKEVRKELREANHVLAGVRDSKTLSPQQRECAEVLIRQYAIGCGVGHVPSEVIDRRGISQATEQAMRLAVEKAFVGVDAFYKHLYDEYQVGDGSYAGDMVCLIDGNSVMDLHPKISHVLCKPKAESRSWSVAAASIIAKVERDSIMHEIGYCDDRYEFEQHKGYGTKQHISHVRRYGISEFHRKSFEPCRTIVEARAL